MFTKPKHKGTFNALIHYTGQLPLPRFLNVFLQRFFTRCFAAYCTSTLWLHHELGFPEPAWFSSVRRRQIEEAVKRSGRLPI